ncbi:Apoptosis-stimulating of p53 protein 2 [Oryzias melastigma]|uniref:Apoptosis-stimulating of p53 protein 2 n=1 Tax=Oryzias melastigma TaxID=30732 RepID=A0A834FG84_ORYME|nr:Apoptosis-stimulating of p53 protein 2 [Oryzias melastigma]
MNNLFQQKQKELVMASSKVEELSRQLELLKNGKTENFHGNQSSMVELDRLYKELQLRNRLNQDQNSKLQQQRENLNKRNLEVAAMDKRISELRDRLWKKKAALQQKENLPNGYPGKERASKDTQAQQLPSESQAGQQPGASRVAAVGPYIQSSTMPRGPARHDQPIKPAYPDGTSTLPAQDPQSKAGAGSQSNKLADWRSSGPDSNTNGYGSASTLPRMTSTSKPNTDQDELDVKRDRKVRPFSMFEPTEAPAPTLRKNPSCDDLVRDAQSAPKAPVKVPPPVPNKPKGPVAVPYGKPGLNTGTFPKAKPQIQQPQSARSTLPPSQSQTLPLPPKQDIPPAAAVRPFTPEPPSSSLTKPQIVAASSIYSMYTKQDWLRKALPGWLPEFSGKASKSQRWIYQHGNNFEALKIKPNNVYGKPVISGGSSQIPENPYLERRSPALESEVDHVGANSPGPSSSEGPQPETERIPRPLSPTKLLPFISNPYRHQSDGEFEALRKKLYNAPRPLKKRSSITEPEGPAGPNIQKLLYQKTTLAAMETTVATPTVPTYAGEAEKADDGSVGPKAPTQLSNAENTPAVTGQPAEAPSYAATDPVPTLSEQTLPPPAILETEEIIPPPPPSHPAPRPEDALFPPPPPPPTGLLDDSLPPPPPIEEFPPYPPPPYPSGADQDSLGEDTFNMKAPEVTGQVALPPAGRHRVSERLRVAPSSFNGKRTNLRKLGSERIDHNMRVKFNPLALLLDSSLEGEYDLVQRIIYEHNAVCAGHTEIVKFLVQFGVNVNAADSDGWTPLHCAASCNNVQVCKFLVESGAAVFAMTYSDMQTAADKCEEMEEGYTQCSQFLYGVQEKMGIMNRGVVYGLWDYTAENPDELSFHEGDCMTIVRREDEDEVDWWWARLGDTEGYIPRNLLGLYPRIKPRQRTLA